MPGRLAGCHQLVVTVHAARRGAAKHTVAMTVITDQYENSAVTTSGFIAFSWSMRIIVVIVGHATEQASSDNLLSNHGISSPGIKNKVLPLEQARS